MTEEFKIRHDLRKAIYEELSISNFVVRISNDIYGEIKKSFHSGKTNNKPTKDYIECSGSFSRLIYGHTIKISFKIFNFRSFDAYKATGQHLDDDFSNTMSAEENMSVLNICGYAIANKLQTQEISDSIHHKIELLTQEKQDEKANNSKDNTYLSAVQHIFDPDIGVRSMASAISHSSHYEQNAYADELYAQLMHLDNPIPRWEDITHSRIYEGFLLLRKHVQYLSKRRNSLQNDCMNNFGIGIDDVIKKAEKTEELLIHKIGKVLIKVNNDKQANDGFIIRAASNGKILYFLD